MTRAEISHAYRNYYNPTLSLLFDVARLPVELRGKGTRLYDENNVSYLDFCAGYGIFALGYLHDEVQKAASEQIRKMAMCSDFLYNEPAADLAQKIAGLLPGNLNRVFLHGSGSEAIENAIRIAHLANSGNKRFIAAKNSYHGKTLGALSVLGQNHLRDPFGCIIEDVTFVSYGNIGEMAEAIGQGALAVILEPLLGGGFIEAPLKGYLAAVKELCRKTGTLLIIDEVQTGFGRTGKMFGIDHDGIVPDIIILSKGMTGGHVPVAATVITDELAGKIDYVYQEDPFLPGTTYSVSPLVCAAASASIDVITAENLHLKAAETGSYFIGRLNEIAERYPQFIAEIPGRGLMTGIKVRNALVENAVWLQLLKRNVIGGLSTNNKTPRPVMRLTPPLIIEKEEIDIAADALEESLYELDKMPVLLYDLANQVQKYQFYLPEVFLRFGSDLLSNPPVLKRRKAVSELRKV